jgi:hypothetical protein
MLFISRVIAAYDLEAAGFICKGKGVLVGEASDAAAST